MMKRLDQRGVAALEFCLVAVPLFTLMFVILDLGRYAITEQSLWALANAQARYVAINCYLPAEVAKTSPSGCTSSAANSSTYTLTAAQMQTVAPFLSGAGLTPTVSIGVTNGGSPLTITVSLTNFTMLTPVLSAALPAPSASTSIPF
ncbi:MAG TPA: TadE/TadG family type IV pilus assembly protein [Roseiarcus sp.]|jgi:Flp pilus assembly protein TadG